MRGRGDPNAKPTHDLTLSQPLSIERDARRPAPGRALV
jgi:hypothetical protein